MSEIQRKLAEKIASEITLSQQPGQTIKKWRETFNITQTDLSKCLGVTPSMISDYESGRRKAPGTPLVKKIVNSLLTIDMEQGGKVTDAFAEIFSRDLQASGILDMREFPVACSARVLCSNIQAEPIANDDMLDREIYGYTVIDSPTAIIEFSSTDFFKLYGSTTARALIFTGVSVGRSPLVAIRVTQMKPGVVILHGPTDVDPLALKIANAERIPLALSSIEDVDKLVEILRSM